MASRNERKRRARERAKMLERAVQEAFRLEHERKKAPKPEPIPEEHYHRKEPVMRYGTVTSAKGVRKFSPSVERPFFGELTRSKDLPYGQRRKRWIG